MKGKLIKNYYGFKYLLMDENGDTIATSENGKLSPKNCQAIERGYDLDELVKERFGETFWHDGDKYFKEGFQKALEILGDKKFSEGDVIRAMQDYSLLDISEDKIIQSLQQNEWDVEIEMEPVFDIEYSNNGYRTEKFNKTEYKPKLDADGCLILKRVV